MICGWRVGRPNLGNIENLDCTEDLTSTVSQTTLQVSLGGQISQTSKYSFATSYILSFLQFCDIFYPSTTPSHFTTCWVSRPFLLFHHPPGAQLKSHHMTKQNRNAAANLRKSDHFTTSVGGNTSHRDWVEILGITDQFSQDQNYFPLCSLLFTFIFTPNSRVKHSKTLAWYICLFSLRLA